MPFSTTFAECSHAAIVLEDISEDDKFEPLAGLNKALCVNRRQVLQELVDVPNSLHESSDEPPFADDGLFAAWALGLLANISRQIVQFT